MKQGKSLDSERWPWLLGGIRPINCAGALRAWAGFTLTAMNVPQVLGYTRIAGIEAVTSYFSSLPQVACFDITARCRKRRNSSRCRAPSRTKIFAAMPMN